MRSIRSFQSIIRNYYRRHARPMPWRETDNPYHIYVSEIMLQQTQVARVEPRYLQFIARYPTLQSVADASQPELLEIWQGLGYNRRARNMGRACRLMVAHHHGVIPQQRTALVALPGIGEATAGALLAYGFNQRVLFIETNIRRVFIHFFFSDGHRAHQPVTDNDIKPLLAESLPQRNIRHWYYALTDYGAMLPRQLPNPNRRARAYRRQSEFVGSHRALRGAIIRYALSGEMAHAQLREALPSYNDEQIARALTELAQEGMISYQAGTLRAAEWKE